MSALTEAADRRTRRLELLASRLADIHAEIDMLSGGEMDAVLPVASGPILLPGAHRALLRQEQEFRALVEQSPDAIVRFDPAGAILYANPAMEELLGRTTASLRGCTLDGTTSGWEGLGEWAAAVRLASSHPGEGEAEVRLSRGEHESRTYACRFHPEFGDDGLLSSMLAVSRDITDRERAGDALRGSREFLQACMDGLSAHLAVVDSAGEILAVNAAWRQFGELNGLHPPPPVFNYLDICDRAEGVDREVALRTADGIRSVLAGSTDFFTLEYPCHGPTTQRWFQLRVTPLVTMGVRHVVVAHESTTAAYLASAAAETERIFLDAVLDQLPVGVIIAEAPTGRLLRGNRRVDEIWSHGFIPADSLGEYGQWEGFHLDGSAVGADEWPLGRAIRTGQAVPAETFQIRRADGVMSTTRLSASPITDGSEEIVAAVMVMTDITAEAAAANELAASEERYRLIFEATTDVLWDWDLTRNSVSWNESIESVLLHPRDVDASSRGWWVSHIHPSDQAAALGTRDESLLGDAATWSAEFRIRRGDDSYVRVLARASILRDPRGRATRLTGSLLDLTARDQIDDAMRLQALLLNTVQQAVVGTDTSGLITSWNAYAEQLYGWPAAEAVGLALDDLLPRVEDGTGEAESDIAAALSRGESWTGEVHLTRRDGRRLTVMSTRASMLDATGSRIGEVSVTTDLTEHRDLQEQLRQSQRLESVGLLAGGIAHDFNNILTVITGNVGFLLEDVDANDARTADLMEIRDASDRAASLTRQLLAFSRRQILQPRRLQLASLVSGIVPMLTRLVGEDMAIHFHTTGVAANVHADPGQLEQVLLNLIVNARDAMAQGGRIGIEVGEVRFDGSQRSWEGTLIPAGSYAMLAVSDTGSGMSPEVMERLFEPFFTTKDVGRGTGLGLSTVYGIVRQSGGHIWLHSVPGSGSVFKIYLPLLEGGAARDEPAVMRPPVGGSETVLLVEDEEAVRRLARLILVRAGYTVIECCNGADAVEMALAHRDQVNIVVMDVVMPVLNGHVAAERMVSVLGAIPVIFMSGYTDDEVLRRGVEVSETRFLQKPFTAAALLTLVRSTLDQSRPRARST